MSCEHCLGLRKVFGTRVARSDLKRYRRRGPVRTTRLLIDRAAAEGIAGATVLDIGGGVGVIGHELLARGAATASLVEASPAYLESARREAERQGHGQRLTTLEGDFTELAGRLDSASIVTLDRVICCYPDMPGLVSASTALAERLYGVVYPRDNWWLRAGLWFVNAFVAMTRVGYRAYVHDGDEIERLIERAGLVPVFRRKMGPWLVALYRRAQHH